MFAHSSCATSISTLGGTIDTVKRGVWPWSRREEYVSLQYLAITDDDLAFLKKLRHLKVISLRGSSISGTFLRSVHADELEFVDFGETKFNDHVFPEICRCTSLNALFVDGTSVTDTGISILVSLPHLNTLSVENTAVTVAGVEQLYSMPELKTVRINGTRITDGDVDHLTSLRRDVLLVRHNDDGKQVPNK